VYAVNEHADAVQSLPAYRSIRDVPAQVELAIVVEPAERVVGVARECAEASVRALLVITAGFAETGAEGRHLDARLRVETAPPTRPASSLRA
jgi:acyl-CoA synthetase (NDP forming)